MDVYAQLKSDLQRGHFAPGTPLKQAKVAELYGVSRIPVRDALARLKNEGWLATYGKRGVAVPHFDPREVEDLFLMRARLEPLLQELATPRLNSEVLGRAQDILDAMDASPRPSAETIGALNWQFHACIYRAAGRPTLFAAVEQLHRQCERYIGFQSRSLDYQDTNQREHGALLALLRIRDNAAAAALLEQHITDSGRLLAAYFQTSRD